MKKTEHGRKGGLRQGILFIAAVLALTALLLFLPERHAGAAEKAYAVLALDRDIAVRENKTLAITDVFTLKFTAEAATFVYRLPRCVFTEKTAGGKLRLSRFIAELSDVSALVGGEPARTKVSVNSESYDYQIAVYPQSGKLSETEKIAVSYRYDLGMDRNKGFDDLTIPLTYGPYIPRQLRVTVRFPKPIGDAELTISGRKEADVVSRTEDTVKFFYRDVESARSERVFFQVELQKGYFSYDSVFTRLSGWYYAAFAVSLLSIGVSVALFFLRRRPAEGEGGVTAAQIAVAALGFLPTLLVLIVFSVLMRMIVILPVVFSVFCGIGYFASFLLRSGGKRTGKKRSSTVFPSVVLFCVFYLLVYGVVLLSGLAAFDLDALLLRYLAPAWAVVTRIVLVPLMSKPGKAKREKRMDSDADGALPRILGSTRAVLASPRARETKRIDSNRLFAVGIAGFVLAVLSIFVVAVFATQAKSDGYAAAQGVVVGYEERTSDSADGGSDTTYHMVVRYEYEGVTYIQTSPSGSSSITAKVGETVDIRVDPLDPRQFVLKSDRTVLWAILGFVVIVLYTLFALAVLVPFLTRKFPLYNWGGIFGSTIFIVFSFGCLFAVYFGMHAKGLADFIGKAPFAFVFLAFLLFGVFGCVFETVRAIRLAYYQKLGGDKFQALLQKEETRFARARRGVRKVEAFAQKVGYGGAGDVEESMAAEVARLDKAQRRLEEKNGEEQTSLRTKRLELVALNAKRLRLWVEDIPALERDCNCLYRGEPLAGDFLDVVKNQLSVTESDPDEYPWHSFWLLVRREDRVAVGAADFKGPPNEDGEVEIGYGLGEEYRHCGYMTEAVRAMCGWALCQPGVSHIVAETEKDGFASHRVLARCGFRRDREGDTVWWRL